jgi:rare lipoprotein A (peptidoglycan hydrolase)
MKSKTIILILSALFTLTMQISLAEAATERRAVEGKSSKGTSSHKSTKSYKEVGIASWYGSEFHGKRTASGATFDSNAYTAAHKYLPLNSVIKVTNLRNNRSINVIINDRGPVTNGRIIDLSKRAARELGFLRRGLTKVKVEYFPK